MSFIFDINQIIPEVGLGEVWIPTKKITHPRAELSYDDDTPVQNKKINNDRIFYGIRYNSQFGI